MTVIVTCGDPSGVGPELAAAVLREPWAQRTNWLLTGPSSLWEALGCTASNIRLTGRAEPPVALGKPCQLGARQQCESLLEGLDLVERHQGASLVTMPVNKGQLFAGGLAFNGHTELFRHRYPELNLVMTFVAGEHWLALVTDHLPLAAVPAAVTRQRIAIAATALHRASARPVALCGLNPHAGEGGQLGKEELGWGELIAELNAEGVALRGPLPADGLFARWRGDEAILAIYHDQGLAPFKARFADRSCQISLGLPFLRTSPDHGTAYDLAGSGRADPGGVRAALQRAAQALP